MKRAYKSPAVFALFALLAICSAGLAAQPAAGSHLQKCGNAVKHGAGAYDIRATKNVSCRTAKRVASRFYPGGERRFNKWKCRGKATGYETGKGTCSRFGGQRPRQAVKFMYGA